MAVKLRTGTEISALIGTPHPKTGGLVIPRGTQNFDEPVNNALLQAADASAGFCQVFADDAAGTTARVLAGRVLLNGVILVYAGGTISLSSYNNDTAYVWLQNNGSDAAQISAAADGTGWPSGNHIKLAEVTLASGVITTIVDRRPETFLSDGTLSTGTAKTAFVVGLGSALAKVSIDNNAATGNFTAKIVPANLTANRTLILPDAAGTVATQEWVAAQVPNLSTIEDELVKFTWAIAVQGNTATPTQITITIKDHAGNLLASSDARYFRIRVCDSGGYADATNATIDAGSGTTVVESITADKDLVVNADFMTGTIKILLTNATAETVTLRIGPAPLSGRAGNYSSTLNVTHAAP